MLGRNPLMCTHIYPHRDKHGRARIDSSKAAGRIFWEKKQMGSMIDPEDAMVTGIAKVHGEKVLTKNLKHFKGIEGVNRVVLKQLARAAN